MLSDVREYYSRLLRELQGMAQHSTFDTAHAATDRQGAQARDQGQQADRAVGHRRYRQVDHQSPGSRIC